MTELVLESVASGYLDSEVLHDVSIKLANGRYSLVGPNGAGKTTLLRTIAGSLRPLRGRIVFDGRDITRLGVAERRRLGIVHVPQGAPVFPTMSVEENLEMAGYLISDRAQLKLRLERIYELFPALYQRRRLKAGYLSGGERAMLSIGRGLISEPVVLLLDEPSIGLDVGYRSSVKGIIQKLAGIDIILLAEQDLDLAAGTTDRTFVISGGRIVTEGSSEILGYKELMARLFFGGK
jgi:branched-chain amino acid transport system ATP-binding protein